MSITGSGAGFFVLTTTPFKFTVERRYKSGGSLK